ncbi:MAG: hypothetical protein MJE77_08125 [Proteobacteria bacterium]|nr:hypothetical protein [Pseudomonadota bacterium]
MITTPSEFERLPELNEARAASTPGARLDAVQHAAGKLKDRIRDRGPAASVRTYDLVTFPYPTRFGLEGAALSPAPFVMLRNRMHLVQSHSRDGRLINVLINPSDSERALAAPFFARQIERYGEFVAKRLLSTQHGRVEHALAAWGIAPEDIDYITFDHLHVQDVRGLLGTEEPEPGRSEPTPAYLPNAVLLAQIDELRTFEHLHPLQQPWYVRDGIKSISGDKIAALDGDYLIGSGLALIRTPGHTAGNHSPVMVTDRGVWTVSENGIAVDAYAPQHSRIPGLARYARSAGVEVILNANTRENTLDQYTSMVLEKSLADPCPDRPEFPQHFSSSELTRSPLAPALWPSYSHGHITHGEILDRRTGRSTRTTAA